MKEKTVDEILMNLIQHVIYVKDDKESVKQVKEELCKLFLKKLEFTQMFDICHAEIVRRIKEVLK